MSLQLKYASHATLLLDDLVETLGAPVGKPGELIPVLMPSRPLVERAKVTLARRYGVSMGVSFLLPDAFIERIAGFVGLEAIHPSWRPEGLIWRLLPPLANMVREGYHPRLQSVCVDSRSRTALARELADRFSQYLYFRPEMIAAWTRNERWDGLPDDAEEDEGWQKELWSRVTHELQGHANPSSRLDELARQVETGVGDLPDRLEVLTTGPLPPILLPLLRALAGRTDVCLRALLPSTEYLGDIRAGRAQMRAGAPVDPGWEGHPLLSHLGRQSIESFRSFDEALVDGGQEYDVIPLPETPCRTLLQQVQADIRAARQPGAIGRNEFDPEIDRSIRFHRCHGARREVEVMRDGLIEAFADLPDLCADEVLVMAPDVGAYGPLAEAICQEGHPSLPLRLAEQRVDRSDQVVRAVKAMLQFAAGRAPLSEGLALLEFPAIMSRVESLGGDVEHVARQLSAAGITWGLDGTHRRALDAGEFATGTWRCSLDRLLAGLWFGESRDACDADGKPALPIAGDLGEEPVSVSAVLDWLDRLIRVFEDWQKEASPAQWAARLDLVLDEIMEADDGRFATSVAADLIDQLRRVELDHGCEEAMSVGAVGDWLEGVLTDEGRSVVRVGGGMAMGGFKPLRAIPCRVLVLMGMHEAGFPRKSRSPAWDLLAAAPRPSDRDPLRDDRQLFLDAILAVEDRVIVTASARNIRSNKDEPFSVCVDTFLRVAARTSSRQSDVQERCIRSLVVNQRLQPFHQSYFIGERASFDESHLEVARILQQAPADEQPFALAADRIADSPVREDLALQELIRDFKDPWSRWLAALQVALPRDGADPQKLDKDPMTVPTGLNRWQILHDVIEATLANQDSYLEERLAADRRLPYGHLGVTMGKEVLELGRTMAELARQSANGTLSPQYLSCRQTTPAVVGSVYVNEAQSVHVIIVPGDLQSGSGHRLEAWMRAIFASAAGLDIETVVVSRRKETSRIDRMPAIGEAVARTSLGNLLQLWRQAGRGLIPFKPATSAAIFKAVGHGDDLRRRGREAWVESYNGIPGDGDGAAAKLAWRGQDPFDPEVLDDWRGLAVLVFEQVENWFASATAEEVRPRA
jgi:exodeoxyribonuclease V gamma subunit